MDVVAAEDTRRSRTLLQHIGATPRMLAVHAHTEATQAEPILALLHAGQSVALVTDAGTPGVSDPGRAARRSGACGGCPVVPIPGASAVATALSASGLPADRYLFLGFPARKGREREEELARAARGAMDRRLLRGAAPPRRAAARPGRRCAGPGGGRWWRGN